jgi:2-(1,2-epoxy-1,2-dihydrophenyl)acetyl-CoA isomerase
VSRCAGAVRIEFNRPEALNALDLEMSRDLAALVERLAADEEVRAVLMTGRGRAFSAGADITTEFSDDNARAVIEQNMRAFTTPTILAIRRMAKPVVAAVNGPAAGVGCSLALASDLVLAAESAIFLLAFANIGLTPDGGASVTLPARIGAGRALALAMLAERVPAAQAVDWGMADRLVPDAELQAVADQLVLRLAAGPTLSYAATKQAINGTVLSALPAALEREARLQGELVASADFVEGTTAFAQKRPARFAGR